MNNTVTIQRTSKNLKFQLVVANLIQLLGWITIFSETPNYNMTAALILGGIALHIITRILIWWHHG
jgi:hypothetical protein